jgi:hypothetical protein
MKFEAEPNGSKNQTPSSIFRSGLAALSLLCSMFMSSAIAATYDLSSGWSNSTNPNSPWTYNEGANALPLTTNWNGANTTWAVACSQPAWAPSNTAGRFLPAWMRMNACAATYFPSDPNNAPTGNVLAGDIVLHTNDNANGNLAGGSANVVFTLPASSGVYTISGALWAARLSQAGSRPQDWQVTVNGTMLASGTVTATVSRSHPQDFSVIQTLNVGDRVQLTVSKAASSNAGDFVGVQLTLTSAAPASSSSSILPQLAFGGGWYTALYFTNTTSAPVSFMVNFTGDDGNSLTIPALGGSSVSVNLAARGAARIEALNSGSLVQGYASAALPAGVTGYGVFRQSVSGLPDQEAVVPLSGSVATTSTLLFDETNYITGVALVNLSSVSNTVTATAHDNQGNIIGTGTIPLTANAKTTAVLRSIPGLAAVAGAVGSVDFSVTTGNLAALGLRFNGSAFTSIPTSDR